MRDFTIDMVTPTEAKCTRNISGVDMAEDMKRSTETRGVPEQTSNLPTPRRKRRTFLEMRAEREAEYAARKAREVAENLALHDAWGDRYGVCYFLGCEEGLVKIGFSTSLGQRINSISPTVPFRLTLLGIAPGGRSRETYYHHLYREHRLFGEWFARAPAIEEEAARLAALSFHAVQLARITPPARLSGAAA